MKKRYEGKTFEAALEAACLDLKKDRADFHTDLIQQETKGFLGIGAKKCIIEVSINDDPASYLENYLNNLFGEMGINDFKSDVKLNGETIDIQLDGEELNSFANEKFDVMESMQFLLAVTVNKVFDGHYKINFNINDYKEKSISRIQALAVKSAKQVQKTRKRVILKPMSAYQRRIVHEKLQGFDNITTFSIGSEPERKVVIAYKGSDGEAEKENRGNGERKEKSDNRGGRNGQNGRNGRGRGGRGNNGDRNKTEENKPAAPQRPKIKQLYPKPAEDEGSAE